LEPAYSRIKEWFKWSRILYRECKSEKEIEESFKAFKDLEVRKRIKNQKSSSASFIRNTIGYIVLKDVWRNVSRQKVGQQILMLLQVSRRRQRIRRWAHEQNSFW
jgi:hypothetical protein